MNAIEQSSENFPENDRILIRLAIARISDIANDLLDRFSYSNSPKLQTDISQVVFISDAIERLITEKRTQFRSRLDIRIETLYSETSYGLFSSVNEKELLRVISNLINNSVESLELQGYVRVAATAKDDWISISVADNGGGIPKEALKGLGNKGVSYGKKKGAGLGLFHARSTVESWGGELVIESQIGKGTEVKITIPKVPVPTWFATKVILRKDSFVLILDDDASIHKIWEQRIRNNEELDSVVIEHLSEGRLLREKVRDSRGKISLFLIDQELLHQKESGLDLIEQLEIQARSILVTSNWDEFQVVRRCKDLGVPIIPKILAAKVPIILERT